MIYWASAVGRFPPPSVPAPRALGADRPVLMFQETRSDPTFVERIWRGPSDRAVPIATNQFDIPDCPPDSLWLSIHVRTDMVMPHLMPGD